MTVLHFQTGQSQSDVQLPVVSPITSHSSLDCTSSEVLAEQSTTQSRVSPKKGKKPHRKKESCVNCLVLPSEKKKLQRKVKIGQSRLKSVNQKMEENQRNWAKTFQEMSQRPQLVSSGEPYIITEHHKANQYIINTTTDYMQI